jgi:predicted nuclease of predicted toxin-antitoxin system
VKVYLDEDLSPIVGRILRDKGVEAVSAHDVGHVQLDDRTQLATATRRGSAIATANVVDFLRLADDSVATHTEHAGIILIPSSFRRNEFHAIADAIHDALPQHPEGLNGLVIYAQRAR